MENIYKQTITFIRDLYKINDGFIPLHAPVFNGNEKKYLNDCIDSTFVSSVGKYVETFEKMMADYTGAKYAVGVINGTAALHIALILSDVGDNDEVITQPVSFIATTNAIKYTGAEPIFIDVDMDTLGLSAEKLESFLINNTIEGKDGYRYNKHTKKRVKACVPMHTFGHPCKIDQIESICKKYKVSLIEDAAESIGSLYKSKHTGTFGEIGIFSFNGNKTITTGGGGMLVTDNALLAQKAKHLTTQAKVSHQWEYIHDEIGYNYRLINICAALGTAQLENINDIIENKRETAKHYSNYFADTDILFFNEPENAKSNFWLNLILMQDKKHRDLFLKETNENNIMTRPIWKLHYKLPMFKNCETYYTENSEHLEKIAVNIPSGIRNRNL